MVIRSISHPAVRGLGRSSTCEGGVAAATKRHYTKHDMAPNLPHCRSMLAFMHETLPTLPLRLFAPNPPDSFSPGVSLSPFRLLREYTPWTHGTRNCPHSHYLYTRRHSECLDRAQKIADMNMTVSADVIPDALNAIPRRVYIVIV